MTENEAISRIKDHMEIHRLKEPRAIYITVALSMAITALKEIQNYRKLGTLEELAKADTYIKLAKLHGTVGEMIDICAAYEEIGTVEECREAVEKQKPKKPEASDSDFDYYKCPVCGEYIWATDNINEHNYCLNCGQSIDWEESEE